MNFIFVMLDIYTKHAWVVPLKNKGSITITNAFEKILVGFGHKLNIKV